MKERVVFSVKKPLTFAIVVIIVSILIGVILLVNNKETNGSLDNKLHPAADREEDVIVDRQGIKLTESVDVLSEDIPKEGLAHVFYGVQSADVGEIKGRNMSIDTDMQMLVYSSLEEVAKEAGYVGGAGVIMDIDTGEILVATSYPELSSEGDLLLNRATEGLYVPGSIIKPFVATAALEEDIISPEKKILSTGSIELTNVHREGDVYVFNDWKAHGYVDMRKALGVSSNIYFYSIGGGFEGQPGLGIEKLEEYIHLFGIGSISGIDILEESSGLIPNPEWKAEKFAGDEWRVGDTYLASIGQHGYEVTPLQMTRAIAAIANGGKLVTPTLLQNNKTNEDKIVLPIEDKNLGVVRDGMEYAVMNGTASGLYMDGITLAAKTGTAEVGSRKEHINSWITGYFPHDNPQYVFTFMLEKGPWGEEVGAVAVAHDVLVWIKENRSEYLNTL